MGHDRIDVARRARGAHAYSKSEQRKQSTVRQSTNEYEGEKQNKKSGDEMMRSKIKMSRSEQILAMSRKSRKSGA